MPQGAKMRRMKKPKKPFFSLCRVVLLVAAFSTCAAAGVFAGAKAGPSRIRLNIEQLPLHFIENAGQVDAQVDYYLQGFDKTLYFTAQGVTIALEERGYLRDLARHASVAGDSQPAAMAQRRVALKLDFIGANAAARVIAEEPAPALVSYFNGPQAEWKAGLRTYKKLVYRDLWPGIDLIYSGTVKRLKYMFLVKPGADPDLIQLAYRGADVVNIDGDGRIDVRTALGGFHDDRPTAYQPVDGAEIDVTVGYRSRAEAEGAFAYGFRVGSYDASLPLVIDPAILVYAGFIGGAGVDRGNAIALDTLGSAYITGETSSISNFPVEAGPDISQNGGTDAFVAKVAADGQSLIYAGFIGGAGTDRATGIAVDGAGNAYVVGETNSGISFPTHIGPDLIHNGAVDAFVAKVNASGSALIYAGFVGGANDDRGNAIALEQGCASNCAAYIAGETISSEATFPDVVGPDLTHNGGVDAFAAKINPAGSALAYSGYIGGSSDDRANGIAVDAAGSVYITGETSSSAATFPDNVGPDLTHNGAIDAFVAKINTAGTALVYAGYLGGLLDDRGNAIAIEGGCASDCAAYITGETSSTQSSFPVLVGPDLTHNGGIDAFVAKIEPDGTALIYAGYVGGFDNDRGAGIAVNAAGSMHLTGETSSTEATFPDTLGPDLTHNGGIDAFVAQVNTAGDALVYAGYVGGLGTDRGNGIALDSSGGVYVVGETNSDTASFPERIGPDSTQNGDFDAFVAKICVSGCVDLGVAQTDAPDPVRVGENVTYTITVINNGPDPATNAILTVTFPSTVTFISSVPAAPACTLAVTLTCDLGNLNEAASSVVTVVIRADARATLRVTSSVSSDETDINPTNDRESTTTLATFPNLVVATLNAVKAALPGATITIDETTTNRSGVAAPESVTRVYFSSDRRVDDPGDTVLYSRNVPVLAAKASHSVSNMIAVPSVALGRYYILGAGDAVSGIPETRENNKKVWVLMVSRPDLRVSALRAPGKAAAGADITITDTTVNKSALDAGASTTRFFLSNDAVFDPGDAALVNNSRAIPALAAKGKDSGSITATIPVGTAPGKYFLIAVADAGAAVMEADENANTRARRITVTP
jgi:uncharacterized repeat protein (TIGR01451 family)